MEIIARTTKIDFIGHAKYAYLFSLLLCIATVYIWIERGEHKYGIDYVGGHEILASIPGGVDSDLLSSALAKVGFDDAIVQSYEAGSNDYSLRFSSPEGSKAVREKVSALLAEKFSDKAEIKQIDFVGPTLGAELKRKALLAIALGLIFVMIYVGVRFEASFAVGAFLSLLHDVVIATGVYLWAGHELNGAALAAALTIVGYSVNDTIVIFDKVREELFKSKVKVDLRQLLNEANNAMLSRTIITTLLTWFSALALLLFGGGAIQDLSLYLVVGVITGCYSTVFIACPAVLFWENMRSRREAKKAKR